jgi:hypothetical protein
MLAWDSNPQAVPVGHQNHRRVPMAVAVVRGGLHEPLDLGLGDVPWPKLLDFWGLPNLQVVNRDAHAIKSTLEAQDRRVARSLIER